MKPIIISNEEYEVLVAMEVLRRYKNKQKDPDAGFDRLSEIMDTIIAVVKEYPTCEVCGSKKVYVKVK